MILYVLFKNIIKNLVSSIYFFKLNYFLFYKSGDKPDKIPSQVGRKEVPINIYFFKMIYQKIKFFLYTNKDLVILPNNFINDSKKYHQKNQIIK